MSTLRRTSWRLLSLLGCVEFVSYLSLIHLVSAVCCLVTFCTNWLTSPICLTFSLLGLLLFSLISSRIFYVPLSLSGSNCGQVVLTHTFLSYLDLGLITPVQQGTLTSSSCSHDWLDTSLCIFPHRVNLLLHSFIIQYCPKGADALWQAGQKRSAKQRRQ